MAHVVCYITIEAQRMSLSIHSVPTHTSVCLAKCTVTGYCLAGTRMTGGGDSNSRRLPAKSSTLSVALMTTSFSGAT